jgi:hypothetical protein
MDEIGYQISERYQNTLDNRDEKLLALPMMRDERGTAFLANKY